MPATLEPATPAEAAPTEISGGKLACIPDAQPFQLAVGQWTGSVLPYPEEQLLATRLLNAEASLDDARQAASMSATSEEVLEAASRGCQYAG
ncbi:MAG: hypothetical protein U0992_06650 [Planctomycetaceae bacterium]